MVCLMEKCTPIADFIAPENPVTGVRGVRVIPQCAEAMFGSVMYPLALSGEGSVIEDSQQANQIQFIFARLIPHTIRKDLPYEVKLLSKESLNAWCLPGGKVAVYKLLLDKIDEYTRNGVLESYVDPETGEVISYEGVTDRDVKGALLGHEMTHADARHTARKLEWTGFVQLCIFGVSAFLQACITKARQSLVSSRRVLTPADRSQLAILENVQKVHNFVFHALVKLGLKLYHLFGSRQHEFEADKYGMQLAVRAGYDWRGALYLQEILKRESGREGTKSCPSFVQEALKWLNTHPSCEERQVAIVKEAKLLRWA